MNWLTLVAVPLVTGLGAGLYWRPKSTLELVGGGLIGALAATPICATFLVEGWGFFGLLALFALPLMCLPVAVVGAVAGQIIRS